MKYFITLTLLISVLGFSSCNKEQAILEDLAGDWRIIDVTIDLSDGSIVDADALIGTLLAIEACDSDQNRSVDRCDLRVNNPNDGMELFLKYDVVRSPGVGERVLQIRGGDADDREESRTLLYNLITRTFLQEVRGDQLTLTSATTVVLLGQNVEEIVITARRP